MTNTPVDTQRIDRNLRQLQNDICDMLESFESDVRFVADEWDRPEGGGGISRIMSGGKVFEKAGVMFSNIRGKNMPATATARNPALAGRGFQAIGVSVVIHPCNPMVPTSHMNVRFFVANADEQEPIWWCGGGFDLTPYYGFDDDVVHWHRMAKEACDVLGPDTYSRYKAWCDDYFHLKHRNEQRGVGGIFFDDLNTPDFETCLGFINRVGANFIRGYEPIVRRRHEVPYTDKQRQFQLYRRGRYVEFNLVYDRGTLFGLQSNGRTESILVSMPPLVRFEYNWQPLAGSAEEKLYLHYLQPQDWLNK